MNPSAQCNMIKQQLRTGNVLDEKILDLYQVLPRDAFVPQTYAAFAYSDAQIPLEHHQHMMTPTEEGLVLQALKLKPHETVLEIGTGSGYLTALLSKLCKKVISLDVHADMTKKAQEKLKAHHCDNVSCHTLNGHEGFPDGAPYDAIIISGGLTQLPESLLMQLSPTHGRLVAFIGQPPVLQARLYTLNPNQTVNKTFLFNTSLPPLVLPEGKTTFVF